ncbi:MAG: ABC transporter ATP-binding protein [Planctomycetota bacterium]
MASLELKKLCKSFGSTPVVQDVDLRVEPGEFLVLVGPSGCGKSTILRLIAGLESPDSGKILIAGQIVNDLEPRERDVAMVFQNYALYPHLTARGNVLFPLKMARMPKAERERKVAEAARILGLEEALDRKPAQLSGGQQQRVALARALVREPRLFLFDEPLSNVDARLRTEMRTEMKRLHGELGTTMIYVTHDQVEAMTLGTRIAVLDQGRVQQVGSPLEVYQRPANRFVAEFIGSPPMNLLQGPAMKSLLGEAMDDGVVIGFRAHDAVLGGPLNLTVQLVEELGHETFVHGEAAGQRLVVRVPAGQSVAVGETLAIGVKEAALHRFDAGTGTRLIP